MVIVMMRQSAGMIGMLMGTRLACRRGRSEADRAATYKGEHTQNHQESLYQQPHSQNLPRWVMPDNAVYRVRDADGSSGPSSSGHVKGQDGHDDPLQQG